MHSEKSRGTAKPAPSGAPEVAHPERPSAEPERNPYWLGLATRVPTRISISPPDDPREREAERAAEMVTRGGREGGDDPPPETPESGGGRPLPPAERAFFGPRLGFDFGGVRLHTDARAHSAAVGLHADAFTLGPDIAFRSGKYAPGTRDGRALLGHELAHVVQQARSAPAAGAMVHRAPADSGIVHFLTDDAGGDPAPGQMRRIHFLAEVRRAICERVEPILASRGRTTSACPYLDRVFRYLLLRDTGTIETLVRRYLPGVGVVASAHDLVASIAVRAAESAATWARTGEIRGVPDEIGPLSLMRDSLLGAPVSRVLFKAEPGGVRADMEPAAIQAEMGAGAPVEGGVRSRMESAFGTSFGEVRTHADSHSAGLAEHFHARAFTVGEHVAFAPGEYRPGTLEGEALIAHELAHVVQQRGAGRDSSSGSDSRGTAELEEDADRSAVGVVAGAWGGREGGGAALDGQITPRLRSGLRLQRCGGEEQAPQRTTLDDPEALRRQGFELVIPGDEPVVGRTYQLRITAPDVTRREGSLDPPSFSRWYAWRPGGPTSVRSAGLGRSHSFTLDAPGEWSFAVEIPIGVDTLGILRHTVQVRDPGTVAEEHLRDVQQTDITGFLVRLELQNLQNVHLGMAEQRFGASYISLEGENPAQAHTNFPDIPRNTYTVHPPEGVTPARYQWMAVPRDLSKYPTQARYGQNRRTIGGVDGFDLGTGTRASWWLADETGLVDIDCTMFDAAGVQIAKAHYLQVILTSAERERATAFQSYMGDARDALRTLRQDSALHLPGVHVTTETGAVNEISLFVGRPATGSGLKIVDVTPGVARREYEGADFRAAIDDFNDGNSYPPGEIRLRVPANTLGIPVQTWKVHTTGASFSQRLSSGWGWASLGLAGLGALAAIIPGAEPLAPAFFLASSGLGALSAGASLYQHSTEAHPSGTSVAIDVVGLAGSLLGLAGAANVLRYGPRVAALTRTGRFVLYTGFATDALGGVFIGVQGAEQIADILDGHGDPEQKASAITRILSGLLLNGALLAWGARDLAATRREVAGALGEVNVRQLSAVELHALSVFDAPALAGLAGMSVEEVRRVAAIVREDPVLAGRLIESYGSAQFVQGARGAGTNIEDLAFSLSLQRRAALVGYAAANLHQLVDASAAAGLSRQLGIEVQIDPALSGGQIQIDYRLGSWLSETRIGIRVSPQASVGDVLLHATALDTIREYRVLSTDFHGLYQRARAWLGSRRMTRAAELRAELEKHALMHEARLAASAGDAVGPVSQQMLQRDLNELQAWMATFRRELSQAGAPQGVIGAQWSESFSQRQLEALLDVQGSGFERYRNPATGTPISEPGFRQGVPIDMGRAQAYYARRLTGATFPDIYGREIATGRMVAMELKTPYAGDTVASFFNRAEVKDNILREMGGRLEHLPQGTTSQLVVDLRGTGQGIPAALADLSATLRNYRGIGDARGLWDGVRFITGTVDAPVLSGVHTIP